MTGAAPVRGAHYDDCADRRACQSPGDHSADAALSTH